MHKKASSVVALRTLRINPGDKANVLQCRSNAANCCGSALSLKDMIAPSVEVNCKAPDLDESTTHSGILFRQCLCNDANVFLVCNHQFGRSFA